MENSQSKTLIEKVNETIKEKGLSSLDSFWKIGSEMCLWCSYEDSRNQKRESNLMPSFYYDVYYDDLIDIFETVVYNKELDKDEIIKWENVYWGLLSYADQIKDIQLNTRRYK
tara:strand:+ start:3411 stop:3749 length:339 start_codon:yes stop_codon:yes gene_type:complete